MFKSKYVTCPICGKTNLASETFQCNQCLTEHLCLKHQNPETYHCEMCAEAEREAMEENARDEQKIAQKISVLKVKAEQGDADAQRELADLYSDGWGDEEVADEVETWYKKAEEGYRKAAEQGDADAQRKLADLYDHYLEKGKDEEAADEAETWYQKAAEGYRKAAEQGDAEARRKLPDLYRDYWAQVVEEDADEAAKWYKKSEEGYQKAAEQGDVVARRKLAYLYSLYRNEIVDYKNKKDRAKWDKKIEEEYRKAAEQGDVEAQLALAEIYINNQRADRSDGENYINRENAIMWYREAAKQGDFRARSSLWPYLDTAELRKEAEEGYYVAQKELVGRLVRQGDMTEALKWYRKMGAEDADLDFDFSHVYLFIKKDIAMARKWALKACEHDPDNDYRNIYHRWWLKQLNRPWWMRCLLGPHASSHW